MQWQDQARGVAYCAEGSRAKRHKPEHFNGEGWYCYFMQRYPTLSLHSADPLSYVQTTTLTPGKIDDYFDLLEETKGKGLA